MKIPQRPKRFIVIPQQSSPDVAPTSLQTMRLMHLGVQGAAAKAAFEHVVRASASGGPRKAAPAHRPASIKLKVVNRSPADGALLLEPAQGVTLDAVKAQAPQGAKVVEEQWYSLERPVHPWSAQSAKRKKPRLRNGQTVAWTITVVLDGGKRRPLRDALVTVYTNEAKNIGLDGTTDRYGKVTFVLSEKTKRVDAVLIDPLHSGWPMCELRVKVEPGTKIAVVPIDVAAADARGTVYGVPAATAGKSVKVAVLDTGVGPHNDLKFNKRGLNTTSESSLLLRDSQGHGSHVAGVIASSAAGWRRGEASAVELHAYRIFEEGDPYASNFAISAAIKHAADMGCDLINLSIGGGGVDAAIRDAVKFAWARGCVCVAATGNDGNGQADYPARYTHVIAVSAIGLEGSWPAGTNLDWTLSASTGKLLGGKKSFLASFSNRGKVELTAPGVAVVSTIFGNRWGVMSGTSMATPIATGVLARRLAKTPSVKNLLRNELRSEAIVAMALQAAEDINLPAAMQGKGLAR